ncbi:MAG: hypothetical protein L0956_07550 [Candidatus Mariimomonas ferrooxydans]
MGHGLWGGCRSGIFGGFGGLGLVGPILNLVITVGLIIGGVVLIIWTIRRLSSNQITGLNRGNLQEIVQAPLDILKSRYAGGEITREREPDQLLRTGDLQLPMCSKAKDLLMEIVPPYNSPDLQL